MFLAVRGLSGNQFVGMIGVWLLFSECCYVSAYNTTQCQSRATRTTRLVASESFLTLIPQGNLLVYAVESTFTSTSWSEFLKA